MDGYIPLTGSSHGASLVTRSSCTINSRISTMHSYNTAYNTRTKDLPSNHNNYTPFSLSIPSLPSQSPILLISIFLHSNPCWTPFLPPILRPTLLLNSPSLRKSLLQTLPLILHIIQQLRQLMSSTPNRPHRRNLFLQRTRQFIHCILRIDFPSIIIRDLDGAIFSVATFEDVGCEGGEGGSFDGGEAGGGVGDGGFGGIVVVWWVIREGVGGEGLGY